MNYTDYIIEETLKLLAIDSPSGHTDAAASHVAETLEAMGYAPVRTNKGGVLVDLGGADAENGIMFETHLDTLGGIITKDRKSVV